MKTRLLTRLFMHGVLFAPLAVFLELNFSFYFPLIFPRPVIETFAYGALQFYEIWLWHIVY